MDLGQLHAQEREFCVTLHSLCIRRLSPVCILCETSTEGTNNADIFSRWLTRPLCSSSGLSSRLSDFCWLCHSLDSQLKTDRSPLSSVVDCPLWVPLSTDPLSYLRPPSACPLPVSQDISSSSPLIGFRAKTDKEIGSFFQAALVSMQLYGYPTWTLTKLMEKKLDGNYTRMLRAIVNKSWKQQPTKQQLYGHLPPITKTIKIRRTRRTGHCWRRTNS